MSNNKFPGQYLPAPGGASSSQGHHFIAPGYPGYPTPDNVVHRGQTMDGGAPSQNMYTTGPNIEIGIDLPLVSKLIVSCVSDIFFSHQICSLQAMTLCQALLLLGLRLVAAVGTPLQAQTVVGALPSAPATQPDQQTLTDINNVCSQT